MATGRFTGERRAPASHPNRAPHERPLSLARIKEQSWRLPLRAHRLRPTFRRHAVRKTGTPQIADGACEGTHNERLWRLLAVARASPASLTILRTLSRTKSVCGAMPHPTLFAGNLDHRGRLQALQARLQGAQSFGRFCSVFHLDNGTVPIAGRAARLQLGRVEEPFGVLARRELVMHGSRNAGAVRPSCKRCPYASADR